MICSKCHSLVPDNMLTCPACVNRANEALIERLQGEGLLRYARGELGLMTRVVAGVRHIKLYGLDKLYGLELAFCRVDLSRARHSGKPLDHGDADTLNRCCHACRDELNKFLQSIQTEVKT